MNNFPVELPKSYLDKAVNLEISSSNVIEQFIRGTGKGGQKVNKTSSTVYLCHKPTGTEVRCQKFREQSKNRVAAYKTLIDKIELQKKGIKSKIAKKIFKLKKQKQKRSKRAQEKVLKAKSARAELKQTRKNLSYFKKAYW